MLACENDMLTVKEAAALLRTTSKKVRQLIKSKDLAASDSSMGKSGFQQNRGQRPQWLISCEEVRRWLADRLNTASGPSDAEREALNRRYWGDRRGP